MMYKFKLKMKLFVTTKIQTSHIKSFFFKLKKILINIIYYNPDTTQTPTPRWD